MIRLPGLAALLLISRLAGAQDPVVIVREPGPGPAGHYLTDLLARPDTRVIVGDTVEIPRGTEYPASVVVIGNRASVAGTIRGDIVVVGGDLFLKPGGWIEGEGIAIGGGAHNSMLGTARRGLTSYRDFTFDAVTTPAGIELRYRETYVTAAAGLISLPELYGLRIPAYDRSNGLSLPLGPTIAAGPATVDVLATYRSQTGRVDPSVSGRVRLGRKQWIDGFAGRDTRSHESWINGQASNSLKVLLSGRDERNWYRATGGWVTLNRMFETTTMTSTYSIGAATERATAARPDSFPTSGPWSFTGRTSDEGMYRPNPQVPAGTITSGLAGAKYQWLAGAVKARLDVNLEIPVAASPSAKFVQTTVDGRVDFPTFGTQRFRFEAHAVLTAGDTTPLQRFAYLGGSGTLPTEDLLAFGGDQLVFVESRYVIPISRIQLPLVGSPLLTFRHILGSAGVQALPDLTQILGVRLSVPFVRAEVLMDTGTRKFKVSAGLSLSR
jgi:hypothetical protein